MSWRQRFLYLRYKAYIDSTVFLFLVPLASVASLKKNTSKFCSRDCFVFKNVNLSDCMLNVTHWSLCLPSHRFSNQIKNTKTTANVFNSKIKHDSLTDTELSYLSMFPNVGAAPLCLSGVSQQFRQNSSPPHTGLFSHSYLQSSVCKDCIMEQTAREPKLVFLRVEENGEPQTSYFPSISSHFVTAEKKRKMSITSLFTTRSRKSTSGSVQTGEEKARRKSSVWQKLKGWASPQEEKRRRKTTATQISQKYTKVSF